MIQILQVLQYVAILCGVPPAANAGPIAFEPFHPYLVTVTIGVPSYVDGKVAYDPAFDWAASEGAGQAVYPIQLDGGMRPRFLSVEVAGNFGTGHDVEATAIVIDHVGTKRTASRSDPATSSAFHWVDIPIVGIIGPNTNALPLASQAILTLRVEFAGGGARTRRVVMFYDRPVPRPISETFPDFPTGEIGDLARLLNY